MLPPIDPTQPVELSEYEQGDLVQYTWQQRVKTLEVETPLVVFSKSYCPYSARAKQVLELYDLAPAPSVIEVDLREDAATIKALLTRLTARSTFPNVILNGKSLGGSDNIWDLHQSGQLRKVLEAAGMRVRGDVGVTAGSV
ncbi:thioredoxin-like protein [Artomyces pyxidatus]|uniref:Thioredoxin-like protein n=1 Tax=Artomyces pyxidatus TaxID=48021 RepID=A0ACB8TFG7_9AGAM|nr:thioredoxin-like protein [Artomyces pyxidatus]